jgi:hypothetical protein
MSCSRRYPPETGLERGGPGSIDEHMQGIADVAPQSARRSDDHAIRHRARYGGGQEIEIPLSLLLGRRKIVDRQTRPYVAVELNGNRIGSGPSAQRGGEC